MNTKKFKAWELLRLPIVAVVNLRNDNAVFEGKVYNISNTTGVTVRDQDGKGWCFRRVDQLLRTGRTRKVYVSYLEGRTKKTGPVRIVRYKTSLYDRHTEIEEEDFFLYQPEVIDCWESQQKFDEERRK